MTTRRDDGYALVAAIVSVAAFAYVAFAVLAVDRGAMAVGEARQTQARLEAAADAGIALALHGLGQPDGPARWSLDSRPTRTSFDGANLTILIQDEFGKIPLGRLDEAESRRMFEAAGLKGARLDAATDAFLDWVDDDEDPRPAGAEDETYASQGLRTRDGRMRTLEELAQIRGMDAATVAALADIATVWADEGFFSPTNADPRVVGVMSEGGLDSPEAIQRRRERAGQRTALDTNEAPRLIGRPLTVTAVAEDGAGGRAVRSVVAVLTGRRETPVFIRQLN